MKNMILILSIFIEMQTINLYARAIILKSRTGDSVCLNNQENPVFVSSGTIYFKEGKTFVNHNFDEHGRQRSDILDYMKYHENRTIKHYGLEKYKLLKRYLSNLNEKAHLAWKKLKI